LTFFATPSVTATEPVQNGREDPTYSSALL